MSPNTPSSAKPSSNDVSVSAGIGPPPGGPWSGRRPNSVVGSCSTRTPSRSIANAATELPTRAPTTWLWIDRIVFNRLNLDAFAGDGRLRCVFEQAMTAARPRRSCLYMPGANVKALEKARTLSADVLLLDLEDSVAPEAKDIARAQVVA